MTDNELHDLEVPEISDPGALDFQVAGWLARHSRLAYSGFSSIAEMLENAGYDRVLFFRSGGANAYLARGYTNSGTAVWVLAFRGTESDYNDILVDITFFKRTADYKEEYRCHGGFLTSLQSFWGSWGVPDALEDRKIDSALFGPRGISEAVQKEVGRDDFLFVTGHSLGGALASLAAYYIDRDLDCRISALHTFGSPRVYTGPMSTGVDDSRSYPVFRFVNTADIVPRVPPWTFGFRHFGNKCYLTRNGEFRKKPSFSEIFWDVGWMRLAYFGAVGLIAALVVNGLGALVPEGHIAAWLASGWAALGIGLVVAFVSLSFFGKVVPYLPKSICSTIGIREFSDHSIEEYARKIGMIAGGRA